MANIKEMQLNAYDVAITLTIVDQTGAVVDVSTAALKTISLKGPDNVVVVKPAVFETDGTDGVIQYITTAGDIDQIGLWYAQGNVVISGFNGPTVVSKFKVRRNITCP